MNEQNILTAISILGARINALELDLKLAEHHIERLKRENEMLRKENDALAAYEPHPNEEQI